MDPIISVAKIAANPSRTSWAQAYNAGKLFAVISLSKEEKEEEEDEKKDFLNVLGKNTLEVLEQEFFSLESKDLTSIKKVFETAVSEIPDGVNFSFITACVVNGLVYVVGKNARASIKRNSELGVILDTSDDISSVSGRLKNGDILILQSSEFKEIVSTQELSNLASSELPNDISENIAPSVHKEENAGAAAIILKYEGSQEPEEEKDPVIVAEPESKVEEKPVEEKFERPQVQSAPTGSSSFFPNLKTLIKLRGVGGINHTRKLILTVLVIIVILLGTTVYFAIQKQNEAKINSLFESVYPKALAKYEEGQNLVDLNKPFANTSFDEAYKILNENKDKFPENSEQKKKILDLLTKVSEVREENTPEKIVQNSDRSKISVRVENGSGREGAAGVVADFLKNKGYNVASTGNADNYKYEGVTLKVKNSLKIYMELLEKDLSEEYEVTEKESDLSSDSPTDALVIIGK
jgi:hypothetical protein